MAVLTTDQIMIVAALGGFTVLLGLVLVIGLGLVVHAVAARATTAFDAYRERRSDLADCWAIDALGTTTHPKEHRG
ncbi:hypothetical protein ME763_32015 [Streptomyces murinus]|uniref:hypothetical protein n=1 Tax=Streptomyces murinus TaxID=33900 RepID=UPI000A1D64D2|nr:hypothetical protein [Streptomyces murinus]WDO09918.1 hypothetical protein ME763_32015 [Streptomyces murinus]